MRAMRPESDDDIDEFLRSLPAAPEGWVTRAEEMPLMEQALSVLRDVNDGRRRRSAR